MYKIVHLFSLIYFFNFHFYGSYSIHVKDTKLVMTYLVHRHGDRTPIQKQLYFSNDKESLADLSEQYGYGQLTNNGKRRAYKIGRFIRRRYNKLLSQTYNSSEIYIRSLSSERCLMTTLAVMAAVYPAKDDRWSSTINWTPVPYVTVPWKYDQYEPKCSCPVYKDVFKKKMKYSCPRKYNNVLEKLSTELGREVNRTSFNLYATYDLYECQLSLGLPLTPTIEKLLPELKEAADTGTNLIFGGEESSIIISGYLLNGFFDAANSVIYDKNPRRVWILSGHDYNVFSMMKVSKIAKIGYIKFGAIFALELRVDPITGIYYVLAVYVSSPELPQEYMQIDGCDDVLCEYDRFVDITSQYTLDYEDWRIKCGLYEYDDDFNKPIDDGYNHEC